MQRRKIRRCILLFQKLKETTWGRQDSQCWHAVRSIASEYYYSYEITDYNPNDNDSCRVKNLVDNFNLYKEAGTPKQVYYFGNYNQELLRQLQPGRV